MPVYVFSATTGRAAGFLLVLHTKASTVVCLRGSRLASELSTTVSTRLQVEPLTELNFRLELNFMQLGPLVTCQRASVPRYNTVLGSLRTMLPRL